MKNYSMKRKLRLAALLLVFSLLLGLTACTRNPHSSPDESTNPESNTESGTDLQVSETEAEEPVAPPAEADDDLRILIASDTHCTHLKTWYEVPYNQRMRAWVNAILEEHERDPFDLIIIAGDVSLDHWSAGGSYVNNRVSTTKEFMETYVSKLPDDVPIFVLAGNHEQYSNEQWLALTGNERRGTITLGNNLFILLDAYSTNLEPNYQGKPIYTPMDVQYIEEQMAQYPDHNVYLISHYFNYKNESEEFKALIRENDRILGLFSGHTHKSDVISMGGEYGFKTIAQTGNFSYSSEPASGEDIYAALWGFRELRITSEGARSNYIVAEATVQVKGVTVKIDRRLINSIIYY